MSLTLNTARLRCESFTLVFEVEQFARKLIEPEAVSFWVNCSCRVIGPNASVGASGENLPVEIADFIQSLRTTYDAAHGSVVFKPQERWVELSIECLPGAHAKARVSGQIGGLYRNDAMTVTFSSDCSLGALGSFVRELEEAIAE